MNPVLLSWRACLQPSENTHIMKARHSLRSGKMKDNKESPPLAVNGFCLPASTRRLFPKGFSTTLTLRSGRLTNLLLGRMTRSITHEDLAIIFHNKLLQALTEKGLDPNTPSIGEG